MWKRRMFVTFDNDKRKDVDRGRSLEPVYIARNEKI